MYTWWNNQLWLRHHCINNSLVFPVNICRMSVPKCPDTSVLSVPRCLDTSAPVPICLMDSLALVPKCLGSELFWVWSVCTLELTQPPNFLHVRCGQTAGWIKMPLGMEVDLSPGHIVLDGDPAPPRKGAQEPPPHFVTYVYCCQTVSYLSTCWALVYQWLQAIRGVAHSLMALS